MVEGTVASGAGVGGLGAKDCLEAAAKNSALMGSEGFAELAGGGAMVMGMSRGTVLGGRQLVSLQAWVTRER